jgi:stress-induced-phosphoprotein 1
VSPEDEEKAAKRKEAAVEKDAGNKLYQQRKFDEALVKYAKARELDPENPTFLLNEAAVLIEQSKFAEAIARSEEAIELVRANGKGDFNTSAKAYARIGSAYMKQDNLEAAIEAFEKSLVEKYDRPIELKLKSAREMRTKREAESYLDPEKAVQLKEEGNAKFSAGKFGDAIEDYTESIRRNPNDPKVYSNRAACYTKLMDWGRALKDVDKALELDPAFVKAFIRKGKIQQFLKQYHKALKTYKAGLELDPQCAELREGLQSVQMAVAMENATGNVSDERRQQAMEDPEVQRILRDPQMQTLLQQMSEDPRAAQAAMADPDIREKIETLINAGVLTAR